MKAQKEHEMSARVKDVLHRLDEAVSRFLIWSSSP